jgi:ssDNA-binding Zn-finger/Zn-ribbon topoisomerase 1
METNVQYTMKQWETVHECPNCGHVLNLKDLDLRAVATGVIVCGACKWCGPVTIRIVEREQTTD